MRRSKAFFFLLLLAFSLMVSVSSQAAASPHQITFDNGNTWTDVSDGGVNAQVSWPAMHENSPGRERYPIRIRYRRSPREVLKMRLPELCHVDVSLWTDTETETTLTTFEIGQRPVAIGWSSFQRSCNDTKNRATATFRTFNVRTPAPQWLKYRYFIDEAEGIQLESQRARLEREEHASTWKKIALIFAVAACIALAHGIYLGATAVETEENQRLVPEQLNANTEQKIKAHPPSHRARRATSSRKR